MIALSEIEPIVLHPSFAGLIGSILSLYDFRSEIPKTERWNKAPSTLDKLLRILAGMACVWYIAPLLSSLLSISTSFGKPAFGFFIGFVGIDLLLKFLDWFKKTDFIEILSMIRSGGKNGNG